MQFLQSRRDRAGFIIAALGAAILFALAPYISGLLGAAVLYVICIGPYRWLAARLPAAVASILTLLGAIVIIAVPLTWVVSLVLDQAPATIKSLQQSDFLARLASLPRIGAFDIGAELAKASGTLLQWLSQQALSLMGGAASASINLVIAFFGVYYMLHSGGDSWSRFRVHVPFSASTADKLRDHFFSITRATLLGTVLTAAAQGGLVGISFAFVGLPNAFFWGTLTAFVSILPVLGSGLVWIPGMVVMLFQHRYGAALVILLIGGVAASNVDNLIRPYVYRKVSNIHPMVTLVGAFTGITYFGIPGLLLGPLAIEYFFELLRFYREEYTDNDGEADAEVPEVA